MKTKLDKLCFLMNILIKKLPEILSKDICRGIFFLLAIISAKLVEENGASRVTLCCK